jgi:hypothetical protein
MLLMLLLPALERSELVEAVVAAELVMMLGLMVIRRTASSPKMMVSAKTVIRTG